MKKTYNFFAAALAVMTMFSCAKQESTSTVVPDAPQAAEAFSEPIPGQYIVVYKEPGKMKGDYSQNKKAVQQKTQEVFASASISGAEVLQVYSAVITGVSAKLSKEQVSRLRSSSEVAYIEQDRIVALAPPCGTPNGGPCDGDGGDTGSDTQQQPYGIARVNGGVTYTGSNVAWIIDTGVDLDHPDLNVDASRGFNAFTSGRDSKSLDDGNGHGSHVAGTIAAEDNSIGVIGVAAGATVVPVKVLDSRGSGSYSGVIAGVDHVAANGNEGDVANMSLGGPVSQALDDAVKAASAKVKFVLAAGNASEDANNHSPARANGTNIYTISAVDNTDAFASFSNYGNPPVDYAAPGVDVHSTWKDGAYNTISGTSMAAPHAAGVLLIGSPSTSGSATGDPDGNADPIIVN